VPIADFYDETVFDMDRGPFLDAVEEYQFSVFYNH
jgi:hypothetical protein